MTTRTAPPDVEAEALAELETYIERTMPAFLRPNAPLPAGWPHSPAAYRLLQDTARGLWSEKATIDYVRQLSLGWRPDELANGPAYGQEAYASGAPVREQPSDLSPELQREANRLLDEAAARALPLDWLERRKLELAAAGQGNPATVQSITTSVRAQVQAFDAQARAAVSAEARQTMLTVTYAFRAKGGKHYSAGVYRISAEELADLLDWKSKAEADRDRHSWPVPAGFVEGQWPPFTISDSPTVRANKMWQSRVASSDEDN